MNFTARDFEQYVYNIYKHFLGFARLSILGMYT